MNTPSGLNFSISAAGVSHGTIITLHPRLFSERTMFIFIPQSIATTVNLSCSVLESQGSLQLTFITASVGIFVCSSIFMPHSFCVSIPVISAFLLPRSRIERFIFLVSTPQIPGILYSFITCESVLLQRKFEGSSLYSRTTSAPIVGIFVS